MVARFIAAQHRAVFPGDEGAESLDGGVEIHFGIGCFEQMADGLITDIRIREYTEDCLLYTFPSPRD